MRTPPLRALGCFLSAGKNPKGSAGVSPEKLQNLRPALVAPLRSVWAAPYGLESKTGSSNLLNKEDTRAPSKWLTAQKYVLQKYDSRILRIHQALDEAVFAKYTGDLRHFLVQK